MGACAGKGADVTTGVGGITTVAMVAASSGASDAVVGSGSRTTVGAAGGDDEPGILKDGREHDEMNIAVIMAAKTFEIGIIFSM
jgi:hypothetical protein